VTNAHVAPANAEIIDASAGAGRCACEARSLTGLAVLEVLPLVWTGGDRRFRIVRSGQIVVAIATRWDYGRRSHWGRSTPSSLAKLDSGDVRLAPGNQAVSWQTPRALIGINTMIFPCIGLAVPSMR